MEQMYQRIVAMVRRASACIASVVGATSSSRTADSVPQTYFDTDRLMKQLYNQPTQTPLDQVIGLTPQVHGYSSRLSLQNEQPASTGSDTALELIESWYQSCTTVLQPEYGLQEHSTDALQSTSCHSEVLDQCGTIPDEAARLLYARTFLAQRGVPKQDMERLLSLALLSECNTYKHLRQRLKSVSYFYVYSGGLTPIRLDVMRGSNSGLRAVY